MTLKNNTNAQKPNARTAHPEKTKINAIGKRK